MEKKIAIFSSHLGFGGIEKSAISYANVLSEQNYKVTLFVETIKGENKDNLNKDIQVIEFGEYKSKSVIIRKIVNLCKLLKFYFKYHNKFYFSVHFATPVKSGAILMHYFSKNNAIWFHGNYWVTKNDANKFLKYVRAKKYNKVVFVSNKLKNKYIDVYPNTKQKLYVLNNPLDINEIKKKNKEIINYKKNKTILLNVGRHEEKDKNILMMLRCINKLVNEGYDFELWLVGSGKDTDIYKKEVEKMNLGNIVKFWGARSNTYPFYKMCDAVLLSSRREGNPVVFLEAKYFLKPIITTDVSDAVTDLNGYGIVTNNNEISYYNGIKKFLDNGYCIKKKFDIYEYNNTIIKKLFDIVES